MFKAMRDLPFTATQFIVVCEMLKDLPDQNGDDDWSTLNSMLKQLKDKEIDIQIFVVGHVSVELMKSPLFEIILGTPITIKPPTTFKAAAKSYRIELSFTARQFLFCCRQANHDVLTDKLLDCHSWRTVQDMLRTLDAHQVNILDFLSSEMTDDMLQTYPLFQLILHTCNGRNSQVLVNPAAVQGAMEGPYDFMNKAHVPPYPPSPYGLPFDTTHFLQWMQAAEANIEEVGFEHPLMIESFGILHERYHELDAKISVAEFMVGREPAEGTPGSIIFRYLIDSVLPGNGYVECELFFANVATGGNGAALLAAQARKRAGCLAREQAIAFVDALPKVDVSTISPDDLKCVHCWSNFDEIEEGINNEPVQLPCDHRHLLGRDCLIEILVHTSSRCPLCRVDIVALVSQAANALS